MIKLNRVQWIRYWICSCYIKRKQKRLRQWNAKKTTTSIIKIICYTFWMGISQQVGDSENKHCTQCILNPWSCLMMSVCRPIVFTDTDMRKLILTTSMLSNPNVFQFVLTFYNFTYLDTDMWIRILIRRCGIAA